MNTNTSEFKYIMAALILGGLILIFGQNSVKKDNDKKEAVKQPTASFLDFKQVADKIVIGAENAPITVVEYTNFLCSHCANFALNAFPQIKEKYIQTGQVKFIIVIAPPLEAALSAYCANEQGKFLEYHDYLFGHQTEITEVNALYTLAGQAGLNADALKQCVESKKYENTINDLLNDGDKRGVDGTPTFFIGKSDEFDKAEKVVGEQSFEQFENIIKQYQ